jgi:hypothetical protein
MHKNQGDLHKTLDLCIKNKAICTKLWIYAQITPSFAQNAISHTLLQKKQHTRAPWKKYKQNKKHAPESRGVLHNVTRTFLYV